MRRMKQLSVNALEKNSALRYARVRGAKGPPTLPDSCSPHVHPIGTGRARGHLADGGPLIAVRQHARGVVLARGFIWSLLRRVVKVMHVPQYPPITSSAHGTRSTRRTHRGVPRGEALRALLLQSRYCGKWKFHSKRDSAFATTG